MALNVMRVGDMKKMYQIVKITLTTVSCQAIAKVGRQLIVMQYHIHPRTNKGFAIVTDTTLS